MAILQRVNGAVSQIIRIGLYDSSTGNPKTAQTNASSGLTISTIADVEATATAYTAGGSTIDTITTLGTYQAPTTGHCRFKEVDATNHPGLYEIHLANSRFAVAGASYLDISVQGPASSIALSSERYDLDPQADVRLFGGQAGNFVAGVADVNAAQIGGAATNAQKLAQELAGRVIGTVNTTGFTPTTTQFECGDITDITSNPIYQNRGFLVTSGALVRAIGVILGDQVGTAGRRLTCAALPIALSSGDTILIC